MPDQDFPIFITHKRLYVLYRKSDEGLFLHQNNLKINPLNNTPNTSSQIQEISFFSLQMLPLHIFLPLQILLDKIKLSEQFSKATNILSTFTICIGFKKAKDL